MYQGLYLGNIRAFGSSAKSGRKYSIFAMGDMNKEVGQVGELEEAQNLLLRQFGEQLKSILSVH